MYVKNATITRTASQPMNTQYGEKQVLTVTTEDGKEEKIWFNVGRQPHATLPMGTAVQILYEQNKYGSMSKKLMTPEGTVAVSQATQVTNPRSASPPLKKEVTEEEVTAYIETQAALLGKCVRAISNMIDANRKETAVNKDSAERTDGEEHVPDTRGEFYENLTAEDVRSMAISLLIQTQRRLTL